MLLLRFEGIHLNWCIPFSHVTFKITPSKYALRRGTKVPELATKTLALLVILKQQ